MLMRVRERISRGVITPFILFIYYVAFLLLLLLSSFFSVCTPFSFFSHSFLFAHSFLATFICRFCCFLLFLFLLLFSMCTVSPYSFFGVHSSFLSLYACMYIWSSFVFFLCVCSATFLLHSLFTTDMKMLQFFSSFRGCLGFLSCSLSPEMMSARCTGTVWKCVIDHYPSFWLELKRNE